MKKKHHQMQETHNKCLGSKIYSTTLLQAKTGKHKGRNALVRCYYISALVLICLRLKKGRATFFRPETIVASSCMLWFYYLKCYSIKHLWIKVVFFIKKSSLNTGLNNVILEHQNSSTYVQSKIPKIQMAWFLRIQVHICGLLERRGLEIESHRTYYVSCT